MVVAEVLTLLHIVAAITLFANLALIAVWKSWADRSGDAAARAFVLDKVHLLDRHVTSWSAVVTFAAGYAIIRVLGHFGGSIAGAPWALASLVVMTVAGLVWYFVLLTLEVKMADAADRARDGSPLDPAYARWSGSWFAAHGVVTLSVLVNAALMVFKPGA